MWKNIHLSKLTLLILSIFILKVALILFFGDFEQMNRDEERNYNIALNFINGLGYTIDGVKTAWHGSFSVMVYKGLITLNIDKEFYITFIHFLSILTFIASIPFFYRLLLMVNVSEKVSLFGTLIYCIYPSNLIYIGNLFLYEKLTLPLLVICFYFLFSILKNRENSIYAYLVPFLIAFSCLIRPSMLLIYFVIFSIFLVCSLGREKDKKRSFKRIFGLGILSALTIFLTSLPLAQKNFDMFGSYTLSTQGGYELMQGHNDLARGSWKGNHRQGEYFEYSKKVIPNLDLLNEYEEGQARKDFAIKWIKTNPVKEVELIARKIAIFMLPVNFEKGYNLINIFVHLLFILSLLLVLFKRRIDRTLLVLLSPTLGALLLSLVFFVGLRWRYYAEPFFILTLTYVLFSYFKEVKLKTTD